jgi:hypothetical protein
MKKTQITQFLQSFVAIPLFAIAMPLTGVSTMTTPMAPESANIMGVVTLPSITTEEVATRKEQAQAIDDFLEERGSPLAGYGQKFVDEAYKNGIDYRLLVSIAGRETTFGRNMCKNIKAPNNAWGWHSCKSGFKSIDEGIEIISKKLGGNDDNIKHYKSDMTSDQILKKYNPDSIVPGYSKQVVRIMKLIDDSQEIA